MRPVLARRVPGKHHRSHCGGIRAAQQRAQAERASNATAANTTIPPQNPALTPYTDPGPVQDNPIPGERTNPSGSPNPNPH